MHNPRPSAGSGWSPGFSRCWVSRHRLKPGLQPDLTILRAHSAGGSFLGSCFLLGRLRVVVPDRVPVFVVRPRGRAVLVGFASSALAGSGSSAGTGSSAAGGGAFTFAGSGFGCRSGKKRSGSGFNSTLGGGANST